MITTAIPASEELRQRDIESYEIQDTQQEQDFDELVELASQLCKCPISLISLLHKDSQFIKAATGFDPDSTGYDMTFCSHTILQDDVMIVEDALNDKRFKNTALVTGEAPIRFYAGVPVISPTGNKLGTLSIMDHNPRILTQEEERTLKLLSKLVTKLFELRMKNRLIRERASEIVSIKTTAIQHMMDEQEIDKKAIAESLHEDLAQSLASAIMYMNMGEHNKEKQEGYLHTAKEQLADVLSRMKKLSYDIAPHTVNWIPVEDLVKEFVEKIAHTFPFHLHFAGTVSENEHKVDPETALVCIRIVEQWLKLLSTRKEITTVDVGLHSGETIELIVEDDSPVADQRVLQKEVYESKLYDRVRSHGGKIDISANGSGRNKLRVLVPAGTGK